MRIDESWIEKFILAGLKEDVGDGDHTSLACIDPTSISRAKLLVKDEGHLAGVELAQRIFKHVDPNSSLEVVLQDGQPIKFGDVAFYVTCNSQALLKAERLVLNSMQRMSGIASFTARFVEAVEGTNVKLLDTRKTTPLLRYLEKWAVQIGGGTNYRWGLYDWIMIKDNHVEASGGLTNAIRQVKKYLIDQGKELNITVEVRNAEELEEALAEGGVKRIMLDNHTPSEIEQALVRINKVCETEASGGINMSTIRTYAKTGVDYISLGALTHSYRSLDLSLKILK